jgi:hypothetical protein
MELYHFAKVSEINRTGSKVNVILLHALTSTAAELLIKKIENKKTITSHEYLIMTLHTKLVIRNSTQKINPQLMLIK